MSDEHDIRIPVNIEDEMRRSYLDYAMSVIVGRALPDVRDGLKPVHRRVLFAMQDLKNDWNKPLKPGPLELGFDYYFGMPTVNSGPPFVYVENHAVVDYEGRGARYLHRATVIAEPLSNGNSNAGPIDAS